MDIGGLKEGGRWRGAAIRLMGLLGQMKDRLLERSDCRGEYRYGSSTPLELERRPVRIAALNLEGERRMARSRGGGKGKSV